MKMVCMTKDNFIWTGLGVIAAVLFLGLFGAVIAALMILIQDEKEVELIMVESPENTFKNTEEYRLERDGINKNN